MSCRRKCWGDTPWEGFFGHIRTIWSVRFLNGCPYQGRRATSGFTPHKTKRRLSSLGESPGRSQAREAGTRRKRIIPTCSARGFSAVLEHDRTRAEETSLWARVGLVCRFQGRGVRVAPEKGILAVLGHVWSGDCPDHLNPEKERLQGAPFRAPWGRSILEQDKGPRR